MYLISASGRRWKIEGKREGHSGYRKEPDLNLFITSQCCQESSPIKPMNDQHKNF